MMEILNHVAVGESDGRCCFVTKCCKLLVRKPGERLRDFYRRKTCDHECKRALDRETAQTFRYQRDMSRSRASTYMPARAELGPNSFQDDPRSKLPDGFLRMLPAPTLVSKGDE
jgi:hypothetical protein